LKQLKAFFQANAFNRNDLFARKKMCESCWPRFSGQKISKFYPKILSFQNNFTARYTYLRM
jgi:hypothetical protein